MRLVQGDIWDYYPSHKLVVTTNIGWQERWGGGWVNNMGAGLASQVADHWSRLPAWYAETLQALLKVLPDNVVPPVELRELGLIFLPVKPLHPTRGPRWSWDQKADLALIEHGLERLAKHEGQIALTLPGCGNGGLDPNDVLPLLDRHLKDDRFLVVDRAEVLRCLDWKRVL